MKLIHISDIHFTIPGEPMGGLNPHARFARALNDIAKNHSDAARIIITGDLAHWGERDAYDALHEALEDVKIPVRLMIGNHDDRGTFLDAFPDHPRDDNGYINYSETLDDVKLIYLDTVGVKTHAGHFDAERIAWLRGELSGAKRARLFMHHQPFPIGLPAEDSIGLIEEHQPAFYSVISDYRDKIDYIHFGHVHAPIHGTFLGIPFASVPSTGNQSLPVFDSPELLYGAPMQPAYFVLLISQAGTTLHQVPFSWDGPVFTAGTGWDDWAKSTAAE